MPGKLTIPELIEKLERLKDVEFQKAIIRDSLEEAKEIAAVGVREHFVESRGPEGEPWAELKNPRPGDNGKGPPLVDTLGLFSSIKVYTDGESLYLSTNHVGARLQHYGGKVLPRRTKYLAIPATREAKDAGSPRNFDGELHPRIGKRGGVLLGVPTQSIGPDGKGEEVVQYYLSLGVDVPARPFLGFSESTRQKIKNLIMGKFMKTIWGS